MSAVSAKALGDIKDPAELEAEMKRLKNIAVDLGGSTSFSVSEVAKSQEILAMAGVSYKDITTDVVQGLLDTGKAGQLGLEETTDIATGVIRGFGLNIKDIGKVGDILAYTANVSSTSIGEMGETFKYVGPVAKAAGMDLKSTSSMIAVLANVGIKGSMAGTSLKNVILGLAAPTTRAGKILSGMHIATRDAQKNMRPLSAILGDLATKMKGLGSAEKLERIEKIFGRESLAGATALVDKAGTAEGMRELQQIELGFSNVEGSASRMGALLSNNTKNAFEQLSGAVETLTIKALDQLLPRLADIVSALTESIGVLTDYAAEYPDFTTGVIAAAAAIGGLAIAGGIAMQTWAVMKMSLATLKYGFTSATIAFKAFRFAVVMGSRMMAFSFRALSGAMTATGIGAIIVGLGLAAWAIYENWDTLKALFLGFWDEVKPMWEKAAKFLSDLFAPFMKLWDKFFGPGVKITASMPSVEDASFVTGKGGLNNPLSGAMAPSSPDFSVTANMTFNVPPGSSPQDIGKVVRSELDAKQIEQQRRARANMVVK
jgi:TP901 family phage tail tape measure protein